MPEQALTMIEQALTMIENQKTFSNSDLEVVIRVVDKKQKKSAYKQMYFDEEWEKIFFVRSVKYKDEMVFLRV